MSASEASSNEKDLWRPISTAPRDKTIILLAKGRDVECGFYDPDDGAFAWVFIDSSVREYTNGWRDDPKWGPSHWRPLPEPPVSALENVDAK